MELSFARTWLPYIYLYGVGGIIFLTGMFIIFKSKSINIVRPRHKKWFGVLIFGFLWYMFLHGFSILAALNF
ncbi:MAG: hypothetical protein HOK95_03330 [Candidatus Marinimicrobia bacterium]|jgi:hypothetical protein|nr:hypothetical protein [Candidatus Neomarinimicrobiota bacterium]MBT6914667.1 hypothetical protein [Candidatus Neomarinimicrobiota bacterium]